jgi:hypothetical protein
MFVSLWLAGQPAAAAPNPAPTLVTLEEARQLVRAIPDVAAQLHGTSGLTLDPPPATPECAFFMFRAWHDTGPDHGSNLVGWYTVNKRTADVWDGNGQSTLVTDPHVAKLQKTIRGRHNIDDAVIKKYRDLSSWLPPCTEDQSK